MVRRQYRPVRHPVHGSGTGGTAEGPDGPFHARPRARAAFEGDRQSCFRCSPSSSSTSPGVFGSRERRRAPDLAGLLLLVRRLVLAGAGGAAEPPASWPVKAFQIASGLFHVFTGESVIPAPLALVLGAGVLGLGIVASSSQAGGPVDPVAAHELWRRPARRRSLGGGGALLLPPGGRAIVGCCRGSLEEDGWQPPPVSRLR